MKLIYINHLQERSSNRVRLFIIRNEDDFNCNVYWPNDFITDLRKTKLENGIKQYIENKSEIPEYNYLVCWKKSHITISLKHFEKYPTLILKSTKLSDKFVKKISERVP